MNKDQGSNNVTLNSEKSTKVPTTNNLGLKFSDKGKDLIYETQLQENRKQLDSNALFNQIDKRNETKQTEVNSLLENVSKYLHNQTVATIKEQPEPEKVDMDELLHTFGKKDSQIHELQKAEEQKSLDMKNLFGSLANKGNKEHEKQRVEEIKRLDMQALFGA